MAWNLITSKDRIVKLKWLWIGILPLFLTGCISPKTDAFLIGAGIGAGITCMAVKGDPLCGRGSRGETLWERQDPNFPDASIPYDMDY